jgi:hypothetical protein
MADNDTKPEEDVKPEETAKPEVVVEPEKDVPFWHLWKNKEEKDNFFRRLRPILRDAIILSLIITIIFLVLRYPGLFMDLIERHPLWFALVLFMVIMLLLSLLFWVFRKPLPPSDEVNAMKAPNEKSEYNVALPVDKTPDEIYAWVSAKAQDQITWYHDSRQPKRTGSRLLRGLAIVFGAIGALAPVIAAIFNEHNSDIIGWGYVFLAVAGACIAGDRLFGLSSGWIRYILTQFKLEMLLLEFQYDWVIKKVPNQSNEERIGLIRDFHKNVKNLVNDETNAWAAEFQTNLAELEKTLKTSTETQKTDYELRRNAENQQQQANQIAQRRGSVKIVVSNPKDFDEIDVYLDEAVTDKRLVKVSEALLKQVEPGAHELMLVGKKGNESEKAQQVIDVPPDGQVIVNFDIPPIP